MHESTDKDVMTIAMNASVNRTEHNHKMASYVTITEQKVKSVV